MSVMLTNSRRVCSARVRGERQFQFAGYNYIAKIKLIFICRLTTYRHRFARAAPAPRAKNRGGRTRTCIARPRQIFIECTSPYNTSIHVIVYWNSAVELLCSTHLNAVGILHIDNWNQNLLLKMRHFCARAQ